jgi:soluble lytic murein transglycosylase-like protein
MRWLTQHLSPLTSNAPRLVLLLAALLALPAAASAQARASPPTCEELIAQASERYRLDPLIFRQLVRHESGCKPRALSHKGAMGLTQLMPATAARFGVRNPYDPAENIDGGARYLRWLLDYFGGDYTLALAGYNAGEGAVLKYGRRVPPYRETQAYVSNILRAAQAMRASPRYVQLTSLTRPSAPSQTQAVAPPVTAAQPQPKVQTASRYYWQ